MQSLRPSTAKLFKKALSLAKKKKQPETGPVSAERGGRSSSGSYRSHSDEDRLSIHLLTKAPIKKRSVCQWSFVCEFLGPMTPAGDLQDHFHPGLGRSPGEGKGYPLQYSGLENSMDCIVHGVTKSQDMTKRLSLSICC